MRLKYIIIPVFSIAILIISGCLEMEVESQPANGAISSTFSATTEVIFIKDSGIDATDDRGMLFAVHKPIGWVIDSITYTSPEHGNGIFTYLGNAADEADDNPGGIDTGWEDSLEAVHPADSLMHWQMYVSDQDTTSASTEADPDTFHITVNYTVDAAEGSYMLKYWTSHTNNGDAGSATNTASAGSHFTAYDPSTSSLVTFTLTDGSWNNHNVKFKGSMSDWNLFPGFDDGTNGDVTAGDHVWTAQFAIIEDGTYEWGAIEDDGSEWGVWLIEGDNPSFTISGSTVTGTTSYTIPAFTTNTPGAIKFTVTDGTASYVDVEWKGSPTSWELVQMYDDGTNGDETASDHVWTAVIENVVADTHEWGVIENDGSEWGVWLINGPNPSFTLDTDLTTYHGQTHYEIPAPTGDSVLVTLTVDDQTWLNTNLKMKGTLSNWSVFQAYDDGTNGDVAADDHIWTAQYLTADGDHQWGAIDTTNPDGSGCVSCDGTDGWGTWLMEGFPNPAFTVSAGAVTGTVNFVIAPDSCETAGSVLFTVHDTNGDYVNGDLRWKGTPTNWELVQMYDDGTNGDETAGDQTWTCIVPNVTVGAHQWGAVNWDGSENGEWLIDPDHGGNPAFTLDADLLTLHGEMHYEIPLRLYQDVTRSVLFQVDMTEWLDEQGSTGYRVFNVALDSMEVRGSFNNWGDCTECAMTRTPGTNIFSHAINVTAQPNSEHQYAFYMNMSQTTLNVIAERYGAGTPPVDWIGWGTSPEELGNINFNLGGIDDDGTPLMLPMEAYYEIFPGHILSEGESMDLEFTIDMSTHAGFNAAEDSLFIRTHDKWLNYVQGFSNGQDINHTTTDHNPSGPTMNEDGTYSMTFDIKGPQTWFIYYKWGYMDMSEATEVMEQGGGLGGVPRIRYFHQDADNGCEWPDQFSFPVDGPFASSEDLVVVEEYDSSAICIVFVSNDELNNTIPDEYFISENYPNPFNPRTRMEFSLPSASDISFKVYSLIGAEVYSYNKKKLSPGRYTIEWNGRDLKNNPVPSGVYIYEFRAGDSFREAKKMTLLK